MAFQCCTCSSEQRERPEIVRPGREFRVGGVKIGARGGQGLGLGLRNSGLYMFSGLKVRDRNQVLDPCPSALGSGKLKPERRKPTCRKAHG